MDIQIKHLEPPYPYTEIAQHLKDIYYTEYGTDGTLSWNETYTKFYFDTNIDKNISREFAYGAYEGKKLIGTLFGHWDLVALEQEQLQMLNLGLTTMTPAFRRQGIAKKMLSQLISEAKKREIDLVIAFPQKGRYGDKLLKEHFDFKMYGKIKHFVKLMEDQGLKAVALQHGTIVTKISSIFSHIPDLPLPEGTIRHAKPEDIDDAIKLINTYTHRVPLATIYNKTGFQQTIREFDSLESRFGPPWGHQWFLLDRNGELYATVCCRVEKIEFLSKNDTFEEMYAALLTSLAFHEKMELDEKKQFLAYILRKILADYPEVACTQITTNHHEPKVFQKLKFIDDGNNYLLYMKPLSKKAEKITEQSKFKEFFLEYYR